MIRILSPAGSQPFGAFDQTETVMDRPNVKPNWPHYLVGSGKITVGSNSGPYEANSNSHTCGPAETWGTEYGEAPSPSGLDWLADRFGLHYSSELTKPYISSTPEDGVQAKWSLAANKNYLEGDYWQQAMDHVQTFPAVQLLLTPVSVSDTQQQVEQFDLPSSDEKKRFLNSLWDAFEVEPLESGFDHPSEDIIRETMLSLEEERVLEWLRSVSLDPQHPSMAASVLRCLGRLERPGSEQWCAALVRSALGLDEPEIRDAAVQAAESWGGKAIRTILEAHTDPLSWLDDYIGAVVEDLRE